LSGASLLPFFIPALKKNLIAQDSTKPARSGNFQKVLPRDSYDNASTLVSKFEKLKFKSGQVLGIIILEKKSASSIRIRPDLRVKLFPTNDLYRNLFDVGRNSLTNPLCLLLKEK